MFPKNYLTIILKKSKISLDVKCSWLGGSTGLYVRKVAMLCANYPRASYLGVFCASKNLFTKYQNYVRSTTRKKTSSEKLVNQRQKKTIKQIISNILEVVKEKFAILKFAENKVKKRDFTLEDLTLIQNLLEKNNGDFPKSWAEFYKLTGTNKNTFNN